MKKKPKILLIILIPILILTIGGLIYFFLIKPDEEIEEFSSSTEEISDEFTEAEKSGKEFSNGHCSGSGPVELNHLPMKEEDFAFVIPYGLMTGAHVTPIDHQYLSPTVFNSPRDTYEVRAVADSKLINVSNRVIPEQGTDEYRLVFMHTCTFFTYYDLVTSLTPEIMAELEKIERGDNHYYPDIEIKAGDLIGYIGGQTLDFAVWDFEKPLDGFVFPEHYNSEPWKIHTANPYEYYSEELKQIMTEKNIRIAEPIAGKIDYDIEGKLIGNWFLEDTNWYAGAGSPYYSGHLSISPDHIDPTATIISIGDFQAEPQQFMAMRTNPDPSEVTIDSEIVKYDLMDWEYYKLDGSRWDGISFAQNMVAETSSQNNGCAMFQVLEDNKLKVELFPNQNCNSLSVFTEDYLIYER